MHVSNSGPPQGRLWLRVAERGRTIAERRVHNRVLRAGAGLIAGLVAGSAGFGKIDAVGIGFATEPGGADLAALTAPDPALAIAPESLRSALAEEAFTIAGDGENAVRLEIAALFRPAQELAGVTEAGLLAGARLYNQVLFEPVTLRPGQDVTFFWQIDFPFGH